MIEIMTIDYDLFREKLNALNGEIFRMTNEQQVLPVLAIHQILKECEVREMTEKVKSEDFIKAFGGGVKETEYHHEERPQGKWIDYDNTFYKCPDCGYLLEKCCPQCQNKVILPEGGADMRGGAE